MMYKDIVFYVAYPYYFPHFIPIAKQFEKEGYSVGFALEKKQNIELMRKIAKENQYDYYEVEDDLSSIRAKVLFVANTTLQSDKLSMKTVFLCHGIGTKKCGFERALQQYDMVLVEGDYRYEKYASQYPQYTSKLVKVGYTKLDGYLEVSKEKRNKLLQSYGLESRKKTILYAPTFFPSSIEKMSDDFPQELSDYNIIIKPHYLSLSRKRYKKQQKKFQIWSRYPNVALIGAEGYNLLEYMAISDVMISDESSAVFEFAAMKKPVIINHFLALRFSYYLNPKKLLKRMDEEMEAFKDVGFRAYNYHEMITYVKSVIEKPALLEDLPIELIQKICGEVDGLASVRVVQAVEKYLL